MRWQCRWLVTAGLILALSSAPPPAGAGDRTSPEVLATWYRLALELVRHTPTQSPPVASRAFAYLGVTALEAVAGGSDSLDTLAGQLNGLAPLPGRDPDATYDEALVLNAALAASARDFFANTGPTGQRALDAIDGRLSAALTEGVPGDVIARSAAHGRAVAAHVLAWSQDDGGAVIENMGFPDAYTPSDDPKAWVPTSALRQQQAPLLPNWGRNRPFAMPDGAACPLPPHPAYNEEPGSAFHREAMEIYEIARALTPEERAIAQFWSDDPMLSPTPPGHWISIARELLLAEDADAERWVDVMARLGIAQADAFIGCWNAKYHYDLLRPVTYIRRVIDPAWEPLLITPPFPEYPSGHSTQSAAAATVLTALFGEDVPFEDRTHVADGLGSRSFPSFRAAAEEAGMSRIYGGIHFRSGNLQGQAQGNCIGNHAIALRTRE